MWPRNRGRNRAGVMWGLADQSFSSATNFILAVIAGRLLGPRSLGVIAIGFSAYLFLLILFRAVLTTPLIVVSGSSDSEAVVIATRRSVAMSCLMGLGGAALLAALGIAIRGDIGRGLLLFAPWMLPALLQDAWRSILFRDVRGMAAALNDGVWLLVMLMTVPVVLAARTEWIVVASWGSGAVAGAILGFVQTRVGALFDGGTGRWWFRELWPLGRWFALDRAILNLGTQLAIFLAASFTAASAIGGLRAVQSLFAPLSLLGPAISFPGLPAIERALRASTSAAWRVTVRLTAVVTVAALAYVIIAYVLGNALIVDVFGSRFEGFWSLTMPIAVGQVFLALGAGILLLLQAAKRAKELLVARGVGCVVMLAGTWTIGHWKGIEGVAWAMTLGTALTTATAYFLTTRLARQSAGSIVHADGERD